MSNQPKDYKKLPENSPTQVEDHIAERGIKYSTIVQSLILVSLVGTASMAYAFGGHLLKESLDFKEGIIKGIDDINSTLEGIRGDIGELNTGLKVNESKINDHEHRISNLEDEE